jgi:phosphate-induced protein 1
MRTKPDGVVRSEWALLAVLLVFFCAASLGAGVIKGKEGEDLVPTGKGWGQKTTAGRITPFARRGANGISYHGGPLILGTTNAYYIWYGNWSNTDENILTNLISSIGGSPYFNINTTYYNGSSVHVTNSVHYAGAATDNYSHGTALSDAAIQSIVAAQSPTDTNAVYFVLTSADVNETSGFCTQYCGWHTHGTINGRDIKYAFIGNPARCPSACTNGTPPPNGSVGADGAASIIAHELEEAVTDPDLNAWYDSRGEENADKCAWTFGTTYSNGTGTANMNLGGSDYLIQRNWVNASGGSCALKYP